jgi:hypothetical protein
MSRARRAGYGVLVMLVCTGFGFALESLPISGIAKVAIAVAVIAVSAPPITRWLQDRSE